MTNSGLEFMSAFPGQVNQLTTINNNDIDALLTALHHQSHLWEYWNALKPNKFNVFENCTQHIVFKYPVDLRHHDLSVTFPLWQEWQHLIQPLINQAVVNYEYKNAGIARIMLAKLLPQSKVPLHIDASPSATIPHKIHIPLQTSEGVVMNFADKDCHLPVGFAYELNNRIQHGVSNSSNSERIHLIFDYFDKSVSQ